MKLQTIFLIAVVVSVLVLQTSSSQSEDDIYLQVEKRNSIRVRRAADESGVDEELERFALNGYHINVPFNGDVVNLCEVEYLRMALSVHPRLKDTLISACTGSSTAKWFVKKIAKIIFKKDM